MPSGICLLLSNHADGWRVKASLQSRNAALEAEIAAKRSELERVTKGLM